MARWLLCEREYRKPQGLGNVMANKALSYQTLWRWNDDPLSRATAHAGRPVADLRNGRCQRCSIAQLSVQYFRRALLHV